MLIEFTVGNYLSFRDRVTLSMEATGISELQETNVSEEKQDRLLRGAVIYGANSSGKSNLIKSMGMMRKLVLGSSERSSVSTLGITPFLLSTVTEKAPSFFEVVFFLKGLRYRYGFEVTNRRVVSEWLLESKRARGAEYKLFTRQGDEISVTTRFSEGRGLESKTRENAFFLSVADQFAGEKATEIMQWLGNVVVVSGLTHEQLAHISIRLLDQQQYRQKMLEFYRSLDLGFSDVLVNKIAFSPNDLPDDMPHMLRESLLNLEGLERLEVKTKHRKFNELQEHIGDVMFDMDDHESAGTKKLFNLSGPIFDVLHDGGVLIVDELDSSIHTNLMHAIIRLFHSSETNPKNAQLIITTHDTNLLSSNLYRRDQVYFVEKDHHAASDLYSLVEYKHESGSSVRKDESYEKNYIAGRYGAIPFLGNPAQIFKAWLQKG